MNKPTRLELPTPFSIGSVNAWLFTDPEPILVDCGQKTDDCIAALEAGLAGEGLKIADLKKVIITHGHVDHAGLAGYLAERCDAEFWVSDYAWDWVCDLDRVWNQRIDFMQETVIKAGVDPVVAKQMGNRMRDIPEIWIPVPADRMVRFNTRTKLNMGGARWDVIYAPGHTQTQTCFYEPESKMLISADMLLHIAPVPVVERTVGVNDAGQPERILGLVEYMKSVERFYDLEVSAVFPGHGPEFKEPHRVVIDRQRDRIHKRKKQCYDLVAGGESTAMGLTDIMYSHFPADSKITGLAMVIGYLDLLMAEGQVSRQEEQGIWHFSVQDN